MIGIIDYKAGNSHSVKNACDKIGVKSIFITAPDQLEAVSSIILPGVGSAGETMSSLNELCLIPALEKRVLRDSVPYLGICVGMQVLFEYSDEGGGADCLGWLGGRVIKFDPGRVRIPQMGWNSMTWAKDSPLRKSGGEAEYFYFVNSFHAVPSDSGDILATADYGGSFVCAVQRGNIFATQFHTEKSGEAGLRILENFCKIGGAE